MIQANDEAIDFIYHNLLEEEMQKNVSFFETFLERRESFQNKGIFNIFIEDMSRKDIYTFLECINCALKRKKISSNVIPLKNIKDIENHHNHVLFLSIDEMDDFHNSWRNSSEDVIQLFQKAYDENNILIVATVKTFSDYSSLDGSEIHKIAPALHFHLSKDLDSIYQKLISRFKEEHITCTLTKDELKNVYDVICCNDYVLRFDIDEYLYNYAISSNKFYEDNIVTIDTYSTIFDKEESNESKDEEGKAISLKSLTGLKNVKNEVNNLFHYASFIQNMNIDKSSTYLNMFFLGNPGTGKTMVANIIANKLYELGYLESKEIVKVVPNDLIGEYVGHTKKVMRTVLNNAKGKLLFIDEAYLIGKKSYSRGHNPFMEEAVIELLKYLEDPKNIVIFAGYKEEMRELYNTNPGLKSRIYKEILFEDYSISELYKILEQDLKKKGLIIDKNAKPKFTKYILELKNDKNFGNARSMLQLSQKLIMNHANHCNKDNKFVIDENDLPIEENNTINRMGFGVYDGR